MKSDRAEALAVTALTWIAAEENLLLGFLAANGADAGELRARASDPEFLGFVLDFLLSDEPALLRFAAEAGIRPEEVAQARTALPGGALPNWT